MEDVISYYKPLGFTPLEAIQKLKTEHPELRDEPITYAGRLDPMAEGVLILLKGKAIKDKKQYLAMDKEYVATILLGIETDSQDALGLPTTRSFLTLQPNPTASPRVSGKDVREETGSLVGEVNLPLPAFSSPPVKGKPLFQWALEGRLDEIEIPKRTMKIYSAELLEQAEISAQDLIQEITDKINLIKGNFRQEQTIAAWKNLLRDPNQNFHIVTIRIECASGTYIRSIAQRLGGTLLRLQRAKVGNYKI